MPTVMDYAIVLETLQRQGLKSLYHNSGAFGFPSTTFTFSRGWIGPPDPSIRESARPMVRQVEMPYAGQLAKLLITARKAFLPGVVWVMPKSHWAYELEFGSRDWLPQALAGVGIDSGQLIHLNHAAAIAFEDSESPLLAAFVEELLARLVASDFQLVFPGRQTICTIHSRAQLWWTTSDSAIAAGLSDLLPEHRDGVS